MRAIGAAEAKGMLATLLDQVEQGEEIVITRGGRSVARLVAPMTAVGRNDAEAAAERIIADGGEKSLGGLRLKDLIDEGRPRA